MRVLFTAMSAFCMAMMLLVFWRVHGVSIRDLEVLTTGVDAASSDLSTLTFLLSDTRAASAPFLLAGEPEGGLMETAGGWISRNLIGGSPVAQVPTELERAFSDSTGLVRWTHDGYKRVDPYQMSREIEKAIIRAHDRGARINIVAQGEDSVAVLMALARLEGQVRGGKPVGAEKVVFVGAKGGFRVPGNIQQLASVWTPRGSNGGTRIQVFGGGRQSEALEIDGLWPPGMDSTDPTIRKLRIMRGMLEGRQTFEATFAKKEADLQAAMAAAVASATANQAAAAQAAAAQASQAAAAKAAPPVNAAKPAAVAASGRTANIEWVGLDGGTFARSKGYAGSEEYLVTVKSFLIAKSAVTNAQYRSCEKAGACTPPNANCLSAGSFTADDQPVVCVTWQQADEFSRWAGGRLPSASEWVYAARSGGQKMTYPWGNGTPTCALTVMKEDQGNLKEGACGRNATWPVCSKPAGNTSQGLCDMYGNTSEWVADTYGVNVAPPADGSAREDLTPGPDGAILRQTFGHAWNDQYIRDGIEYSRSERQNWRYTFLSFRVVRPKPSR